jgi:hypothetical protein
MAISRTAGRPAALCSVFGESEPGDRRRKHAQASMQEQQRKDTAKALGSFQIRDRERSAAGAENVASIVNPDQGM